jgi:hypothetical protein
MGSASFVAWLFVSAVACLVVAFAERSVGWLLGCVVLSTVALYARRQLRRESGGGRASASGGFVLTAIAAMLVAMAFIFWLQFKA